jgi:hypothetical protein
VGLPAPVCASNDRDTIATLEWFKLSSGLLQDGIDDQPTDEFEPAAYPQRRVM